MSCLPETMIAVFLMFAPSQAVVGAGVIDGDTFETADGRVVRILNINTPELGTEEGNRAYYYARKLLRRKKVVLVREGKEKGKYGRYLFHVILPDGSNFAERMIRRGYSRYFIKYGKSVRYGRLYEQAEFLARRQRRGVWRSRLKAQRQPFKAEH